MDLPEDLPLQYNLWMAEEAAAGLGMTNPALLDSLEALGLRFLVTAPVVRILVEVRGDTLSGPLPSHLVTDVGGLPSASWEFLTDCWIPVDTLVAFARSLPSPFFAEVPLSPVLESGNRRIPPSAAPPLAPVESGVADLLNARSFIRGGYGGTGVTVAIIDGGFGGLAAAQANGDAPPDARISHRPDELGTETHGTACLEVLYELAPFATYRLYSPTTGAEYGEAIEDGLGNGVTLFSHSMAHTSDGWVDCGGPECLAAMKAVSTGAMFFTAAGNEAQKHFEATIYSDPDGRRWHQMPDGSDEIQIRVAAGSTLKVVMQWERNRSAMDLHLYRDNGNGPFRLTRTRSSIYCEWTLLVWENTHDFDVTTLLGVSKRKGPAPAFELFIEGGQMLTNIVSYGSTSSPSCAKSKLVVPVGAVSRTCYTPEKPGCTAANPADPLESYSSWGPSNQGVYTVTLTGPDELNTLSEGIFAGTSCATPAAAGIAAIMLAANPSKSGLQILDQLTDWASRFRDWRPGFDRYYGYGGVLLPDIDVVVSPDGPLLNTLDLAAAGMTTVKVALYGNKTLSMPAVAHAQTKMHVAGTIYDQSADYQVKKVDTDALDDVLYTFSVPPSFPTGTVRVDLQGKFAGSGFLWIGNADVYVEREGAPVANSGAAPGAPAADAVGAVSSPGATTSAERSRDAESRLSGARTRSLGGDVTWVLTAALRQPAELTIFDASGRVVSRVTLDPGMREVSWNGRDDAARPVAAGIYLARLRAGTATSMARVVMVR